jgi:hypothetical protein
MYVNVQVGVRMMYKEDNERLERMLEREKERLQYSSRQLIRGGRVPTLSRLVRATQPSAVDPSVIQSGLGQRVVGRSSTGPISGAGVREAARC